MIRELENRDIQEISRLHTESGAQFTLPNLESPLVLVKKVVDDGGVRMAAIGRLHISALMWVNHRWATPQIRFDNVMELQREMMLEASRHGLDIATTQADGRFAERLEEMGWTRGNGFMYYKGTVCR
jgi:hypothetical protein